MHNVHKTYLLGLEGVQALRGVDVTIKKGEFACILGTSGGGKTTMLNLIGTIDKPTKGDLYLCGLRIKHNTPDRTLASIRLNKVAFVFQSFNLITSLTALENVELPMQLRGKLSRRDIRNRATELLDKVGLADRKTHFPNMLSGGEQQRVTIARALSNKPEILLLDEPTGDLDTRNTDIVMKILMDLNKSEQITMVMVTHDVALKTFASKIIRMYDGKVHSI
jgi:putative ABC transport system ATP-binding protein